MYYDSQLESSDRLATNAFTIRYPRGAGIIARVENTLWDPVQCAQKEGKFAMAVI